MFVRLVNSLLSVQALRNRRVADDFPGNFEHPESDPNLDDLLFWDGNKNTVLSLPPFDVQISSILTAVASNLTAQVCIDSATIDGDVRP